MGKYTTILGAASTIDNEERPYVVLSIDKDGDIDVSLCINNGGQLLQMFTAVSEAFGNFMLSDQNSSGAKDTLYQAGFTEAEANRITGISGLVAVTLGTGNEQMKQHLSSALARTIQQLVVENKTLSEAAEATRETRH